MTTATDATTVRTPPNHDTLTCYTKYGCRLPDCVARARAYDQERRAAQAAGQWHPRVDADIVREHLRYLAEHDITLHRAAELAGVGRRSLHPLFPPAHGRRRPVRHTVRAEIAAKILAVTPEAAIPGRTDAIGAARRIQALVARGWPMRHLAAHMGVADGYVHAILQRSASKQRILGTTARKVDDAYNRLKTARPTDHGVTPRLINQARNLAASRGWPPPSYWDERMDVIDDRHFEPDYGVTRAQIIADEARWLIGGGLTRDLAAKQLGVSLFYVERSLREHPEIDGQAAA